MKPHWIFALSALSLMDGHTQTHIQTHTHTQTNTHLSFLKHQGENSGSTAATFVPLDSQLNVPRRTTELLFGHFTDLQVS